MILADTSIWIDHFRTPSPELGELVERDELLIHPFVIGELSLGSLARRAMVLNDLSRLNAAVLATVDEVSRLIDSQRLYGLGIGYVDAHLLASAVLTEGCELWTRDKRLGGVAMRLGVASQHA